jgi:hypothetical protein
MFISVLGSKLAPTHIVLKYLFPNAVITHEVIPPLPSPTTRSFLHGLYNILELVLICITHQHGVIRLVPLLSQSDVIFHI